MIPSQKSNRPADRLRRDSLHSPSRDLRERGDYDQPVFERSLYTRATLHPLMAAAVVVAAGVATAAALSRGSS